jgi:hypothetical protein
MSNPAREQAHSAGITHYTVLTCQREKLGLWRPGFGLGAFFVAFLKEGGNMAEKKAAQAVQLGEVTRKAIAGVEKARQAAERGELVDRRGNRMNPASIANLRPGTAIKDMEPERKREIQQAGQKASVEAQKKRRTIKEIYSDLLQQPDNVEGLEDEELAQRVQEMARERGKPVTLYESIAVAMAAKAKAGDVKAAVFVRDSAGDKPADQMEITAETMTDADRKMLQNIQQRMQKNDAT